MKGALLFIAIFALSMLIIPMIALSYDAPPAGEPAPAQIHTPGVSQASQLPEEQGGDEDSPAPAGPPASAVAGQEDGGGDEEDLEAAPTAAILGVESFKILDERTGQVLDVPMRDFVRGAVAAEMPAVFHAEALKAQAVAAHTYALRNHRIQQENPDPALRGADFSADPAGMKVFITEETAREFYGEKADEYWEKVCAAADEVANLALAYEDEPIVAAYHAISSGMTEDASNVWVGSAPYLLPADSEGDLLAPDYETKVTLSNEKFKAAFAAAYPGIAFEGEDLVGEVIYSPSGYVTDIRVGDLTLHGKEVREVLGLRSHAFEVQAGEEDVTVVVYGYGHGVGLSQYGADFMARQGAGYREILHNYYTDAALCEVVI